MIGVTIAAVIGLTVFSIAAAGLTIVAARHPDRAAGILVVVVSVVAAGAVGLALLLLGIGGIETSLGAAAVRGGGPVPIHPVRATVGLISAGVLLATAVWLVRSGDWARVDDGVGTQPRGSHAS